MVLAVILIMQRFKLHKKRKAIEYQKYVSNNILKVLQKSEENIEEMDEEKNIISPDN